MNLKLSMCVAVAAGLWGCSTACTDIGCGTSFDWSMDSPLSMDDLIGTEVELCHNDDCVRGTTLARGNDGSFEEGPGQVYFSVDNDATEHPELNVEWWLPSSEAKDGDVYRITLFDAEGALLHESMETVDEYSTFYPNGKECGGSCKSASVDSRANPDD